jgi:hypothetical protein
MLKYLLALVLLHTALHAQDGEATKGSIQGKFETVISKVIDIQKTE